MPTYAFQCGKCGNIFETVMSVKVYCDTTRPAPKCVADGCDGQQDMHSIPVTGGGFVLKGTGWTPKSADSWGAPTDIAMPKKR